MPDMSPYFNIYLKNRDISLETALCLGMKASVLAMIVKLQQENKHEWTEEKIKEQLLQPIAKMARDYIKEREPCL